MFKKKNKKLKLAGTIVPRKDDLKNYLNMPNVVFAFPVAAQQCGILAEPSLEYCLQNKKKPRNAIN